MRSELRRFVVPREGERQETTARQYVARIWPEGTAEQVDGLFQDGRVEAEGVVVTRPDRAPAEQVVIEVRLLEEGEEVFDLPDGEALLWGDEVVVVEKPVGIPGRVRGEDPMDPLRFMADMLGLDREEFGIAWEMPATAGGPWVLGRSQEAADRVKEELVAGRLQSTWVAMVERPEKGQGIWENEEVRLLYAVTKAGGPLAEVQVTPEWKKAEGVAPVFSMLRAMGEAGFAALGDDRNGGYGVAGGVRLRLAALYGTEEFGHSWPSPKWWPWEEVVVVDEEEVRGDRRQKGAVIRELAVSGATLRVLGNGAFGRKGHPWVLRDKETGSIEGMEPGDVVRLAGPSGPSGVFALVDGTGPVVARHFTEDEEEARDAAETVEIRLDEAIAKRSELFSGLAKTDVFRIVHGEADGLPGLWVDRIGPMIRLVTRGRCGLRLSEMVVERLREMDPSVPIVELEHTVDLRQRDELPEAVILSGAGILKVGQAVTLREDGLRYRGEPWEGVDVGFFADQRENRRRAREVSKEGQRWLNLFCHTGAFSVALAAKGVHTTNVDLSRRYLRWLDQNLELNGIDLGLRRNVDEDARRFLEKTEEVYDGIIVDPPTAASGEAGFWSVREHYGEHLKQCFEHLAPGGHMLVCRNERRPSETLEELVKGAARSAGVKIGELRDGPPASDYPVLKGFPEGTMFRGLWVRRSA